MENQVKQFLNENFGEVRTVLINKEIWFVASDICGILDLSNTSKALENHKEGKDKTTLTISYSGNMTTNVLCVSEQGLYKLIFKSRKPFAEEFQDWICGVVIPAIRKDGAYIDGEEKVSTGEMSDDEFVLKAMQILSNKVERLTKENLEMKPKAEYHDKVLNCDNLLTVTDIAKDLSMSARKLNEVLKEEKIQYKQSGTWYLYSKYENLIKDGFCDYKMSEHGQQLKWTEKGRQFIIDLLNNKNSCEV